LSCTQPSLHPTFSPTNSFGVRGRLVWPFFLLFPVLCFPYRTLFACGLKSVEDLFFPIPFPILFVSFLVHCFLRLKIFPNSFFFFEIFSPGSPSCIFFTHPPSVCLFLFPALCQASLPTVWQSASYWPPPLLFFLSLL